MPSPISPIRIPNLCAAVAFSALTAACGGGDEDTSPTGPVYSCDDQVTAPYSSLTPEEYPANVDQSIPAAQRIAGLWQGVSCADSTQTVTVKFEPVPVIPDEIDAVLEIPDSSLSCGCGYDPLFGADNQLDLVATTPTFTMVIDPEDGGEMDPAIDNRLFEINASLFGGQQGLLFRACYNDTIDPYLNSTYGDMTITFRLETIEDSTVLAWQGAPSLTIQLDSLDAETSEPFVCEITGLTKVTSG